RITLRVKTSVRIDEEIPRLIRGLRGDCFGVVGRTRPSRLDEGSLTGGAAQEQQEHASDAGCNSIQKTHFHDSPQRCKDDEQRPRPLQQACPWLKRLVPLSVENGFHCGIRGGRAAERGGRIGRMPWRASSLIEIDSQLMTPSVLPEKGTVN